MQCVFRRLALFGLIILALPPATLLAEETGLPFIQNYTARQYNGADENWAITQDLHGVMYFANHRTGVLQYNGADWQHISTNSGIVRALACDSSGTIYVGAQSDFGYLHADAQGQLRYRSLLEDVPVDDREFSDVWHIFPTQDGVYFHSYARLFLWQNGRVRVWPAQTQFLMAFRVNEQLYVYQEKVGLMTLKNDSLQVAPGGEYFADKLIRAVLPLDVRRLLIGTQDNGLFWYDHQAAGPLSTPVDSLLKNNRLFDAIQLSNGGYGFATWRGGLLLTDTSLTLQLHLTKADGLPDDTIWNLYVDRQDGLWLALNRGLSRVEWPSPITILDARLGIDSTVRATVRHAGVLYVATDVGLSYWNGHRFAAVTGLKGSCYALLSTPNGLLAATFDGVYHIRSESGSVIMANTSFGLGQSYKFPNIVYVGQRAGVSLLQFIGGQWQKLGQIRDIDETISSVVEDAAGQVWLGTANQYQGVLRLTFAADAGLQTMNGWLDSVQTKRFTADNGLPPRNIRVAAIAGQPFFRAGDALYWYDSAADRFHQNMPSFSIENASWTSISNLVEIADGNVMLDMGDHFGFAKRLANDAYTWDQKSFGLARLTDFSPRGGYPETSGIVWLHSSEGLIRYDTRILKNAHVAFLALIQQVTVSPDSVVFFGHDAAGALPITLTYTHNAIRFALAAPSFEGEAHNRYQYTLEGFEERWSDWSAQPYAIYTNLSEGSYTFQVRARNIYGVISAGNAYRFKVLPPWYRTWWAYLIYICCIGGLGFMAHHWRIRQMLRQLEKERIINEKLRQLDRLKDDFLANTSHELRTPLNGIIGLAEAMADGSSGDISAMARANLELIIASGRRLANLVNDVLDFSKLKTREIRLERGQVDIRTLTDVVLTLSRPLIHGKKVELENQIPLDAPCVYADENRLQQIMYNLVGNGIKFTETGKVAVHCQTSADSSLLTIAITDTGIGIAPENFERLFKSFEQLEDANSRQYGGTGLGLSITRQLVELHGGAITVQSQAGVGSTFAFTMPIAANQPREAATSHIAQSHTASETAAATSHEWPKSLSEAQPIQTQPLESVISMQTIARVHVSANDDFALAPSDEKFHLLVVDDEPVNQQVLANHLLAANYRITQAMNGEEAMRLIASGQQFDLILLDVMMPRVSGYEVCQAIRQKFLPNELPILMVTAKNQTTDLVQGLAAGANDYLTKPFSKAELLSRIKTHLNLLRINSAYGRFIPHEFFHALGRDSILDIQLGDQIHGEMTVLFSDIRSYTTLAESMTPQDTFSFINGYLSRVGPAIKENNGFVNQYYGDGIMALFPKKPSDAVQAAIEMQSRLAQYNVERAIKKRKPIQIGIGIHTGSLMMGIIGDGKRMEAGVVADTVNTAARMEGLTKIYGASILMSEFTLAGVPNREQLKYRFLGKVQVKGKKLAVSIYDVYSGDSEESIRLKLQTKTDFDEGLLRYYQQDLIIALTCFKRVRDVNPGDKAAIHYLNRCATLLTEGVPENWQGVEEMTSK